MRSSLKTTKARVSHGTHFTSFSWKAEGDKKQKRLLLWLLSPDLADTCHTYIETKKLELVCSGIGIMDFILIVDHDSTAELEKINSVSRSLTALSMFIRNSS